MLAMDIVTTETTALNSCGPRKRSGMNLSCLRWSAKPCCRTCGWCVLVFLLPLGVILYIVSSGLVGPPDLLLDEVVDLTAYPEAVCMNGNPAWYQYKQAAPSRDHRWVLWLPGCGWCTDERECSSYGQQGVDSHRFQDAQPLAVPSVLDTRSYLRDSHIASVVCCSGDAYMGDSDSDDDSPWFFKGQRIVDATLADLMAKGLGQDTNQEYELVLGGYSSGARGVMANCDRVAALLPPNVKLRCFMDSGHYLDAEPVQTTQPSNANRALKKWMYANTSRIIPNDCSAAYPGDEEWKCLLSQYRVPFIKTPYFLVHSQMDSSAIANYVGWEGQKSFDQLLWTLPFSRPTGYEYVQEIRRLYVAEFEERIPTVAQTESAVFAPACVGHALGRTPSYFNIKIGQETSIDDAFTRWFEHDFETQGPATFRWSSDAEDSPGFVLTECFGVPYWAFALACFLPSLAFLMLMYELVRCYRTRRRRYQEPLQTKGLLQI